MRELMGEFCEPLGVKLIQFTTNDEAAGYITGSVIGVVADLDTHSDLTGLDLLDKFATAGVGYIMVLSSTAARSTVIKEAKAFVSLRSNLEVFDKAEEMPLCALYLFFRQNFKDTHLTRNMMIKYLGFEINEFGDISPYTPEGILDLHNKGFALYREVCELLAQRKSDEIKAILDGMAAKG